MTSGQGQQCSIARGLYRRIAHILAIDERKRSGGDLVQVYLQGHGPKGTHDVEEHQQAPRSGLV